MHHAGLDSGPLLLALAAGDRNPKQFQDGARTFFSNQTVQYGDRMERNGEITFFVPGIPVPKGSAKAFMRKGMKFPVVMQDNNERQKPWASAIGYAAQQTGVELQKSGAIALALTFYMPRPAAHYRAVDRSKGLKVTAPTYHTKTPDLDKLIRCVKDALTGVVWHDDSQVAMLTDVSKLYGEVPGVLVTISRL